MTIYLRQSTASQEVLLGPFVDSTDGNTAETALSIANTDIKLWLAGATTLANKNSGGATHISNGNYYAVLDATDTATLGSGAIVVQVAGALAFRMPFTVLTAQVYDSLIAGSDLLDISMTQILGTAVSSPATAGILDVNVKNIDNDAASASGTVTFPNATLASTTNISAGTITTATNVTTVNGLAAAVITAASIAADAITDAKVAADVTIASVTGAVGSVTGAVGSVTGAVGSVTGAVGSVTGAVGSVTGNVGGNVTGSVGSVATGGITASSIAADAIGASELAADAATEIATAVWAAATRSLTALGFTLAASDLAADTITAAKVAADVTTEIHTPQSPRFRTGLAHRRTGRSCKAH